MYRLFKILSILILIIVSFQNIQAQVTDNSDNAIKPNEFYFPPVEVVIDSVIKRSAMVNFRNTNIEVKEAALASERIHWARNLGVSATTNYGNVNNFSTSEDGVTNSSALTITEQLNYSTGLYLRFPLFDAINRKNQIKLAKAEVAGAKNMVEFENEQIRKMVISLYQEVLLKQKLLQIRSKGIIDGRVNMQMVEKEFRNGVVPISEYVRISSITTNLEAAYETALSEFITSKKMLEDMSGFVFVLKNSN